MKKNKFIYLIASISATLCCFSCSNKKPDPSPDPEELNTIIKIPSITNGNTIRFDINEGNFTVDWGDKTINSDLSHTYTSDLTNVVITISGTFKGISFADSTAFFDNNNLIDSITLGHGITNIPSYAFKGLVGMTSITLPHTIQFIGKQAFYNCINVAEIAIPKSVTVIEEHAIYNCFDAVILCEADEKPKGWSERWSILDKPCYWNVSSHGRIGYYSYATINELLTICNYNGSKAENIAVPEKINGLVTLNIGGRTFDQHYELKSVQLPSSLKSIGDHAFQGCRLLNEIIIPNGVTTICDSAYFYCERVSKIVIPSSVVTIGYAAFASCGISGNPVDIDLTDFTISETSAIPQTNDENVFGSIDNYSIRVVSKKMAETFVNSKKGWPTDLDKYNWPGK